MSDDSDDSSPPTRPEGATTPSTGAGVNVQQAPRSRAAYLVPAIALIAGLAIGGGFVALTGIGTSGTSADSSGSSGSSGQATSQGGTTPAGPTAGGPALSSLAARTSPTDIEITVPAECVQLTNDSQALLDLVNQAVVAARDLDATRLSGLVSQLQQAQERLQRQTDACRGAAPGSS